MGRFLESVLSRSAKPASKRGAVAVLLLVPVLIIANFTAISEDITEMAMFLGYKFIQRALIVGVLVALCAALLGVTLVLKRYSMIGDGLSHVGFGALSIAAAMGFVDQDFFPAFLPQGLRNGLVSLCASVSENPLPFTLALVIALAFLILRLSENSSIRGDAAIALLSTASLAVGVLVTSLSSGMNVDVMNYMFGSILAMSQADVIISVSLSAVVLLLFVLFRNRIFAVTFDEPFARATGTNASMYNMLIAILTAVTIVIGMRMMGTMLISSLIIFPALSSMRVFSNFRAVLVSSAIISVICFVVGIMISCLYSIPAGAGIVLVNLAAFLLFSIIGRLRS